MADYAAHWIKQFYTASFIFAIICAFIANGAKLLNGYTTVLQVVFCFVVGTALCSVFCVFCMLLLIVKVLITLGTGYGWHECKMTAKRLAKCRIADGVLVAEAEYYTVLAWRGFVIPTFVERIAVLDEEETV